MKTEGRLTKVERLGEFVRVKTGKLDANASSVDGEYPFFTCSEQPLRIASFSYDCECVLVAGNGDLNVKYYEGKFDAYQRTYIIESADKKALDVRYLFHFMSVYVEQLRAMSVGGVIKYIKLGYLTDAVIPLPPLSEQRRIAEILDKADALQAKRRAALAQLDTLTQSIFLDMFGDPATNPKGFPVAHMGDVCDVRDGTHGSPKYVSDGGYPLVTSKNVTGGEVDLTDANYISEADYVQINRRSKVDRGDIILPMIGTIGSPVLVDHEPRYAIKNVALIKFTKSSPSAVFVRQLLSGHYFDYIVSKKNRGGTQKFVSLGDLRAFPLPLPPYEEQQEFSRRIESVCKIRTTSRTSEAQLNALLTTLQHRAFQGEL